MAKRIIKGRGVEVVVKSNPADTTGTILIKHNYNSSSSPTVSDSSAQGYSVGSLWINTSTRKIYSCVDNTVGAAIWILQARGELIQDNHLGSTDAALDNSVAGRGIFLKRPDGTLREIALDDDDNIVVYTI